MTERVAKDFDFSLRRLMGGITLYPYQISFGITLRYWVILKMPSIRIHLLFIKIWIGYSFLKNEKTES